MYETFYWLHLSSSSFLLYQNTVLVVLPIYMEGIQCPPEFIAALLIASTNSFSPLRNSLESSLLHISGCCPFHRPIQSIWILLDYGAVSLLSIDLVAM